MEFEVAVTENRREILLEVRDLIVEYKSPREVRTKVLDRISFEIRAQESMAILGESGSGKSTLALSVLRLLPANAAIVRGAIYLRGQDILKAPERALEEIRGDQISMVFQQPGIALNPVMRVCRQVTEVIKAHRPWNQSRCRDEAKLVLQRVIGEEYDRLSQSYPHELSGGQRQRVSIAQALACNPELLIADEPTSSLDAVAQASVLKLFQGLRSISAASLMLITHNPTILPGLVDRVLVMRGGKLVEEGILRDVYRRPRLPYTAELLRSVLEA
jgi:ABC-type dipeptide/oligopeptide/nickel transport system ATPase component